VRQVYLVKGKAIDRMLDLFEQQEANDVLSRACERFGGDGAIG